MHRIDGPGAAPGGLFTDGDPAVGTPATVVTDDWLNATQEELANVVLAAGFSLSKSDNAQVLKAIGILIDLAVPVGTVQMGYFSGALPGYLMMRGEIKNRTAYPRLWAAMQARGCVVSEAAWLAGQSGMFSDGDGSTTFRTPRPGGRFPRLLDDGSGLDAGRSLGSVQADELRSHTHDMGSDVLGSGDFPTAAESPLSDETRTGNPTLPTGGAETRPVNIAWAAMIRF